MPTPRDVPAALARACRWVTCPVCGDGLAPRDHALGCGNGHRFDLARQGYVDLGRGRADPRADTVAMVLARERVQSSGLLDAVAAGLADVVATHAPRPGGGADRAVRLLDAAGGTGYHAADVADALGRGGRRVEGVVVELSTAALRRAARCHPDVAALGWDLRRPWPVRERSVDVVTSVFGPRHGAEVRRVLAPGGRCVVVAPRPGHLQELVGPLAMLRVAQDKSARVVASLPDLRLLSSQQVTAVGALTADRAVDLVLMGPSAHHVDPDLLTRQVDALVGEVGGGTLPVTVDVDVMCFGTAG